MIDTPPAETEPNPDFGVADVSLLLDVSDLATGAFVPGLYGSAAVAVYDVGLPPQTPTAVGSTITISTGDDYNDDQNYVRSRGWVTSAPEPSSFLLFSPGLLGLVGFLRRKPAN